MTKLCYFNQDNPHFSALRALSSLVVGWWLMTFSYGFYTKIVTDCA